MTGTEPKNRLLVGNRHGGKTAANLADPTSTLFRHRCDPRLCPKQLRVSAMGSPASDTPRPCT